MKSSKYYVQAFVYFCSLLKNSQFRTPRFPQAFIGSLEISFAFRAFGEVAEGIECITSTALRFAAIRHRHHKGSHVFASSCYETATISILF